MRRKTLTRGCSFARHSHASAQQTSGLEAQQLLLYLVQLRLAYGCKALLTQQMVLVTCTLFKPGSQSVKFPSGRLLGTDGHASLAGTRGKPVWVFT